MFISRVEIVAALEGSCAVLERLNGMLFCSLLYVCTVSGIMFLYLLREGREGGRSEKPDLPDHAL